MVPTEGCVISAALRNEATFSDWRIARLSNINERFYDSCMPQNSGCRFISFYCTRGLIWNRINFSVDVNFSFFHFSWNKMNSNTFRLGTWIWAGFPTHFLLSWGRLRPLCFITKASFPWFDWFKLRRESVSKKIAGVQKLRYLAGFYKLQNRTRETLNRSITESGEYGMISNYAKCPPRKSKWK